MTDISSLSAYDLLSLYRERKLSPLEVTKAAFEQIAAYNGSVNAFVIVDEEAALESARASESRWMQGNPLGLADGLPTTVKDLLLTKGWATRRGSKAIFGDQTWEEDAPAVARLREQGAVLLGKTTTSEFGWKAITDSPLTGITRNPWNLDFTPGGSSGDLLSPPHWVWEHSTLLPTVEDRPELLPHSQVSLALNPLLVVFPVIHHLILVPCFTLV